MKYRKIDKYKYVLDEAVSRQTKIKGKIITNRFFDLVADGKLWVHTGYAWNGSNWSLDINSKTASLFHDCLYQMMRMGMIGQENREYADQLYRDICIEKGVWKIHANVRYWLLRQFGWGGARITGEPEDVVFEE